MKPKRLISLLVAVCMMITMLPLSAVTAFAADTSSSTGTASSGGYKYDYEVDANGNATITKFLGPDDSVNPVDPTSTGSYKIEIPTELDQHPVTGLGRNSFAVDSYDGYPGNSLCSNIHSVTIPESVKSIDYRAFHDCDGLESLTFNGESIGSQAFDGCTSLTTLKLGENIQTIGGWAFESCSSLKNVTIPESVTSIGYDAFAFSGLESLTINGAINTMEDAAFFKCENLKTLKLGEHIKTIGSDAFKECSQLREVTIPDSVTSIGYGAFLECTSLTTLKLGEKIETIGASAFKKCGLTSVTIPEKVEAIYSDTFNGCSKLEYIILPAGFTSFGDSLEGCPDGCVIYYNGKAAPDDLRNSNAVLAGHKLLCLRHVTFDAKGGELTYDKVPVYETEKITETIANDLTAIPKPTRTGYNFTGWYTDTDYKQLFNADETITKDITLYAGWEFDPNAPSCHTLTLKDGVITSVTVPGKNGADPEDITEIVKKNANEDGSFNVPEGATVSVAFDKDAFADSGLKFGHWDITGLDDPNAYQDKESFDFVMPAKGVTLKAMTQDASIEDDEPDIVGPIVIGTTVVVGGAVLGYQAYSLGAEFAGKLMALPYFPSNRSALAMMLWEDAGKPMPESELLYPDVGQEERDMDLQHAARWAMENELIPDLNDEGTAPEEMKFYPDNAVSKIDVLKAWQKAQELKNN